MSSMVRASCADLRRAARGNRGGEIALAQPHGRGGQRLGRAGDAPAQQHAGQQRQHGRAGRDGQQPHLQRAHLAIHLRRRKCVSRSARCLRRWRRTPDSWRRRCPASAMCATAKRPSASAAVCRRGEGIRRAPSLKFAVVAAADRRSRPAAPSRCAKPSSSRCTTMTRAPASTSPSDGCWRRCSAGDVPAGATRKRSPCSRTAGMSSVQGTARRRRRPAAVALEHGAGIEVGRPQNRCRNGGRLGRSRSLQQPAQRGPFGQHARVGQRVLADARELGARIGAGQLHAGALLAIGQALAAGRWRTRTRRQRPAARSAR